MFEDSLLESGGKFKDKRGRYTSVAFLIEALLLGVALLIPLYYTEELPAAQLFTMLIAPPPPPPPSPPAAAVQHVQRVVQTDIENGRLRTPTRIPKKIQQIVEDTPPPPVSSFQGVVGGIPNGTPGGTPGGVIGSIISNLPQTVPQLAPPKVIRVSSGVSQGMLVRKVTPTYPPLARQARIQGAVMLEAMISAEGYIVDLKVMSGHPMLVGAAVEAVKQWKYKPYLLNGSPVEVSTQIQVNFNLSGSM